MRLVFLDPRLNIKAGKGSRKAHVHHAEVGDNGAYELVDTILTRREKRQDERSIYECSDSVDY